MPFSASSILGVAARSSSARRPKAFNAQDYQENRERFKTFPGSAFLEKTFCGSIDTTDPAEYEGTNFATRILKKADIMCVSSPSHSDAGFEYDFDDDEDDHDNNTTGERDSDDDNDSRVSSRKQPPKVQKEVSSSALLAKALVLEVTDNPKTMRPAQMAEREYMLLKAQQAAQKVSESTQDAHRAVGAPGGVGQPAVLHSLAYACTGDETIGMGDQSADTAPLLLRCAAAPGVVSNKNKNLSGTTMMQTKSPASHVRGLKEGSSQAAALDNMSEQKRLGPHSVTIGLCLSRQSVVGNPGTVTRQTAFDWNELQDRDYKYVSSIDEYGWRAGGGEPGGPISFPTNENLDTSSPKHLEAASVPVVVKKPAIDQVHIPIITIDCPDEHAVSQVIQALASGDIFIPHMAVMPEALSVQGTSPPNLIVRFDCDRTEDDAAPEDWPNWCLEFMHNQLYEYFLNVGARWTRRPFHITLAQQVRWKTVKHMNRYFARAEKVLESWKTLGPQYLNPEQAFLQGGASSEEVAHPHGVYLFRNGLPTNYFPPNFDPPYTTRMTRSLLLNVLNKSWDKKARDWTSEPIPKLLSPTMLLAVACGCSDPNTSGFMAKEVTKSHNVSNRVNGFESETALAVEGPVAAGARKISSQPEYQQAVMAAMNSIKEEAEDELFEGLDELEEEKEMAKHELLQQIQNISSPAIPAFSNESATKPGLNPTSDPPGESLQIMTPKNAKSLMNFDSLDEEDGRQKSNIPLESSEKVLQVLSGQERSNFTIGHKSVQHGMDPVAQMVRIRSPKAQNSNSILSLDYSTDGSSAFLTTTMDESSILFGQKFTTFESNSMLSHSSLKKQPIRAQYERPGTIGETRQDTQMSLESELSLTRSGSSFESDIPTDEELFEIGWAKARDPKTGAFYYFTLDRTHIVWENPLNPLSPLGEGSVPLDH